MDSAARVTRCIVRTGLRAVPGYLHGFSQPCVEVDFELNAPLPAPLLEGIRQRVCATVGELPRARGFSHVGAEPGFMLVAQMALATLCWAGWPSFGPVVALRHAPGAPGRGRLALPAMSGMESEYCVALDGAAGIVDTCLREDAVVDVEAALDRLRGRLDAERCIGRHLHACIVAADREAIPWKRVAGGLYQFGWGAKARWMDREHGDLIPAITASLMADRPALMAVLHQAGIPVPLRVPIASPEVAIREAERMGFPVVLVSRDPFGGTQASDRLYDSEALRIALRAVEAPDLQVVLEKPFAGHDYQFQVLDAEVVAALHRRPGGVVGDGMHTVEQLVRLANDAVRAGIPKAAARGQLAIDGEAERWLERQSIRCADVPVSGRFVRLRSRSDERAAGTVRDVLPLAHADNLALATRVAAVLRMQAGAVEILLPNIARSWLETGAAVCAVRALGAGDMPGLPTRAMQRLLPRRGRLPAVVVIGGGEAMVEALFARLRVAQPALGTTIGSRACIAGQVVRFDGEDPFSLANCLLGDPRVQSVAFHFGNAFCLEQGCPVDRIDHLVLAGPVTANDRPVWPLTFDLASELGVRSRKVWLIDEALQWPADPALERSSMRPMRVTYGALLAQLLDFLRG